MLRTNKQNYEAPTVELYPSIFYKFRGKYDDPGFINKLGVMPSPWDGKKIVQYPPFDAYGIPKPRDVVYESEIFQYASPHYYRLVTVYPNGTISQLETKYRPERLNVFIKYDNVSRDWRIIGMNYM